ncbi:MAG: sulfite exporter TauE/SafE family protein [FCB group bacterium]|nr:sulfite exporter TauE/SafE family protein [FCB group bacterium]
MQIDYIAIFLIGFLSSFSHCYGMCGGFVFAYSVKMNKRRPPSSSLRRQMLIPHLLYNGGRIVTYSILGGIFGLLGGSLRYVILDFQSVLLIIAGVFMVFFGLDFGGWLKLITITAIPGYERFRKFIGTLLTRISNTRIFLYGLVLGLIPCGLVYVALAGAASTGSAGGGMITMFVFGLGTVPALFILGISSNYITVRFRRRIFKMTAVFIILFGLITIWKGGMKLAGHEMDHKKGHNMKTVSSERNSNPIVNS